MTSGGNAGRGGVEAGASGVAPSPATPVVAMVKDLFFLARIRETARLVGVPCEVARTPEEVERLPLRDARLVVLDLTGGFDYERLFRALGRVPDAPVLGFTTHVLARQTQPWHGHCRRVVTKETLTRELPALLRDGLPT